MAGERKRKGIEHYTIQSCSLLKMTCCLRKREVKGRKVEEGGEFLKTEREAIPQRKETCIEKSGGDWHEESKRRQNIREERKVPDRVA